jgi:solute carrier family 35 protein F5
LVSYSDQLSSPSESSAPLIGDLLALSGAIFYGCYTTMLKLKIGNEERIDMPLFFGFVGAFNVLLLWPIIPLLHHFGLETFEIPANATLWTVIVLNAFIGTFL